MTNPYAPPDNTSADRALHKRRGSRRLALVAAVGPILCLVFAMLMIQSGANDQKAGRIILLNFPLLLLMVLATAWRPGIGSMISVVAAVGQIAVALLIWKNVYIAPDHITSFVFLFTLTVIAILGVAIASWRISRADRRIG